MKAKQAKKGEHNHKYMHHMQMGYQDRMHGKLEYAIRFSFIL